MISRVEKVEILSWNKSLLGKSCSLFHNYMMHMYHGSSSNNSLYFGVIYLMFKSLAVLVTHEHVELFNFVQFFIDEWYAFLLMELIGIHFSVVHLWNI